VCSASNCPHPSKYGSYDNITCKKFLVFKYVYIVTMSEVIEALLYFNSRMIEKKAAEADLKTGSIDNDDIPYSSDYGRLKGLQQAIFVMKCFERGFSKGAILEMAQASDGDNIGALGWIQFLKDIRWLQENEGEDEIVKFLVTKKGNKEISTYEEQNNWHKRQAAGIE
jgi:hypothetical protein